MGKNLNIIYGLVFVLFAVRLSAQSEPCEAQWLPSQGSVTAKNLLYNGTFVGKYKNSTCNASEENARWYKFVATGSAVNFMVSTTNCNGVGNNGLSFAIFEQRTPNCIDLKPTNNCIIQQNNAGVDALNATVLAQKLYFLQVDGLSGAQCDFTISYPAAQINSQFATVNGRAVWDLNNDCKTDANDTFFSDAYVLFKRTNTTDSTLVAVDKNGNYSTSLPLADYTARLVVRGEKRLWQFCQNTTNINVNKADIVYNQDFLLQKTKDCGILEASITTKGFAIDEKSYINITYKNIGSAKITNARAKVTLSPALDFVAVNKPFAKYDNVLFVNVGDVLPQTLGNFQVSVKAPMSLQENQAFVNTVEMMPNNICFDNPLWTGGNIKLAATCQKDTVRFTAKNVGNKAEKVDGIIVEDIVMLVKYQNSTTLQPNDSLTLVKIPANGKTFRIETNQAANFPLRSMPTVSIEGCQATDVTKPFSTGFLNQLPQDDADFATDIDVFEAKTIVPKINLTASPSGYDTEKYIAQNQDVEYQVRIRNSFLQNINNLTVLSTFNEYLDLATLQPMGSNYPFRFEVIGNTAQFIFSDIKLYDNKVKKDSSDLFVHFRIAQKKDVPLNAELVNVVNVNDEDDNLQHLTLYKHKVGKQFLKVSVNTLQVWQDNIAVRVMPNPFVEKAIISVEGLTKPTEMTLKIIDIQGKTVATMNNEGQNNFVVEKNNLQNGLYFFVIESTQKEKIATGRLVVE